MQYKIVVALGCILLRMFLGNEGMQILLPLHMPFLAHTVAFFSSFAVCRSGRVKVTFGMQL